jgi:hypothetical protein
MPTAKKHHGTDGHNSNWGFLLAACIVGIAANAQAQITLPSAGNISTVAGNGNYGNSGNGGAATGAELGQVGSVAVDSAGNIYIGDVGSMVVRKVSASTG